MEALTNLRYFLFMGVFLLAVALPAPGKVMYVDDDANGLNDGSSWVNAYRYLQDALVIAKYHDEIWVAEGIYTPDKGGGQTLYNREASFVLVNGAAIYGGFPNGGGTWDQRDPNHVTILSGDLKHNDRTNIEVKDLPNLYYASDRSDNSYHVVRASMCGLDTVLDMVTIRGGHASEYQNYYGGGIHISNTGSPTIMKCIFVNNSADYGGGAIFSENPLSKPVLTECTFKRNAAYYSGGAVCNNDSSAPRITNCTFVENFAGDHGGAIYNIPASPVLKSCAFLSNVAGDHGGAIANYSSSLPELSECRFEWNSAGQNGGAIFNESSNPSLSTCTFAENEAVKEGGAIYNSKGSCPRLVDCIFRANVSRSNGGAIKNDGGSDPNIINCLFNSNTAPILGNGGAINNNSSRPWLINCTFCENYTSGRGGGIYNSKDSRTTLANCILWANRDQLGAGQDECAQIWYQGCDDPDLIVDSNDPNRPIVNYCCIMGWTGKLDGEGNTGEDPRFEDSDGPDNQVGTEDDNLRLSTDSSCIDAGDNTAVPPDIKGDLEGVNRFQDGPAVDTGKGTPPIVDMGAYELCGLRLLPAISQVRQDWEKLGQPPCWCAAYQCDGDVDNATETASKYRIYGNDLATVVANWKRKIDDPKLDPCADIDHKSETVLKYRVYGKDLATVVANWKKKDAGLPRDCPRPE